jgi:hypothetical protein
MVELIQGGESRCLILAGAPAVDWRAYPKGLVELTPAPGGLGCEVRALGDLPLGLGRCYVSAMGEVGFRLRTFYLVIRDAGYNGPPLPVYSAAQLISMMPGPGRD